MNKKHIIIAVAVILVIILVVLVFVSCTKDEVNISKQEGANIYVKLEKLLKDNKFSFTKQEKNGLVYDAKRVVEYTLNDGSVIDVYEYEDNNETYKKVKKTGKLIVIGSDARHDVTVIDSENAAIRFTHEGKKSTYIKNILY